MPSFKPHRSGLTGPEIRAFVEELARRGEESLKIFRPQDHQDRIFYSQASELLVRGGNRSGKSVCVACEVASAALRVPLRDSNGAQIPFKYPAANRQMTIWLVGFGEKHIGQTFHRLLFQPGLFEIIRDDVTGLWRDYQPWRDWGRRQERRPAPPLIPKKYIESWGWKNKAIRHFEVCRLINGTEIYAFTSIGDPKMGDPVDLIWVDEAIKFPKHYAEWQARISDRKGRIIWSAWPGRVNSALINLHTRARSQKASGKTDVEEVQLAFSHNKFIDDDEKRKRIEGWSEDEVRSRDYGEFVRGTSQVYPTFSVGLHSTPNERGPEYDDAVDAILRKNGGIPPDDWRRDLVLDPGHSHPGVLFAAIPPPKTGLAGVIFNELYLPNSDATELATECAKIMTGTAYHLFVIDYHAGRQTPMGFSKTIADQYADAFAEAGLFSEMTGNGFQWASDGVDAGIDMVRTRLRPGKDGRPWLRVVSKSCPNLLRQMELYEKTQDARGFVMDKPSPRQIDCLCDCLRYWVQVDPRYVFPDKPIRKRSATYLAFHNHWVEKDPGGKSISLGLGDIQK